MQQLVDLVEYKQQRERVELCLHCQQHAKLEEYRDALLKIMDVMINLEIKS